MIPRPLNPPLCTASPSQVGGAAFLTGDHGPFQAQPMGRTARSLPWAMATAIHAERPSAVTAQTLTIDEAAEALIDDLDMFDADETDALAKAFEALEVASIQ